jgi:tetratricopeptide (TPR) repeat protein
MSPTKAITTADERSAALAALRQAQRILEAGQPGNARTLAEQAVALSRVCGDRHLLGWGLMVLGQAELRADRVLPAHAAASEAYVLLGDCGDVPRQLWALSTCARVELICGDALRSIELLRMGLVSAHGPGCSAVRCALLINLGERLVQAGEHAEAIQCLVDAFAAARLPPQLPGQWIEAATRLAMMHVAYADALVSRGRQDDAAAQLRAAEAALPPLDPLSWRRFSHSERCALVSQVEVLSGLGRWRMARSAAAATLWSARGGGIATRAGALMALAELHRRSGRVRRAIAYETRVLNACCSTGDAVEMERCLGRLASLHAQTGDHGRALAYGKELKAHQGGRLQEANALRCRLAAIERRAERRRYQANEALVHAQRMAVIGRMIAQTHHALSAPIARAHRLSALALTLSNQAAPHTAPADVLSELSHTIDSAAALVSQLKLFSYRSTPQPMALSLRDALLGAWHGLAPHLGTNAQPLATLDIADHAQVQAWADAQRLGIMLKVLLIQLTKEAGWDVAPNTVRARIEPGEASTAVLYIEAAGRATARAPHHASTTLGVTLCMEIAGEMGGALHATHNVGDHGDHGGMLRYRLQLPDAQSSAPELPLALDAIAET